MQLTIVSLGALVVMAASAPATASDSPPASEQRSALELPAAFFEVDQKSTAHPEVRLYSLDELLGGPAQHLEVDVWLSLAPEGEDELEEPVESPSSKARARERARRAKPQNERAAADEPDVDAATETDNDVEPEGEPSADEEPLAEPPEDLSIYPRARGLHREGRAFWYAAGATALTTLGVKVLTFLPALVGIGIIASLNLPVGPAATLALAVALLTLLVVTDGALAGLVGSLVYDRLSRFYESSYVAGFAGHVLGDALAVGVSGVVFGGLGLLVLGTTALGNFIQEGVGLTVAVVSFFAMIPAFALALFAAVAIPALVAAFSISATASPRKGFKVDPAWDPLADRVGLADERRPKVSPLAFTIPGS